MLQTLSAHKTHVETQRAPCQAVEDLAISRLRGLAYCWDINNEQPEASLWVCSRQLGLNAVKCRRESGSTEFTVWTCSLSSTLSHLGYRVSTPRWPCSIISDASVPVMVQKVSEMALLRLSVSARENLFLSLLVLSLVTVKYDRRAAE